MRGVAGGLSAVAGPSYSLSNIQGKLLRRAPRPRKVRHGCANARAQAAQTALTAATSDARPSFASAKSIPVLGFVYSSLSMPA
jgi:hypothetical protein